MSVGLATGNPDKRRDFELITIDKAHTLTDDGLGYTPLIHTDDYDIWLTSALREGHITLIEFGAASKKVPLHVAATKTRLVLRKQLWQDETADRDSLLTLSPIFVGVATDPPHRTLMANSADFPARSELTSGEYSRNYVSKWAPRFDTELSNASFVPLLNSFDLTPGNEHEVLFVFESETFNACVLELILKAADKPALLFRLTFSSESISNRHSNWYGEITDPGEEGK
ncbi:MAG: hypothetical protein WC655_04865 [Candidatus Hydrogenedentales bacterium]